MRIVSWNMNHARRTPEDRAAAWEYLRTDLKADVALVQESLPPPEYREGFWPIHESNRHYNWGSAIVALDRRLGLNRRHRVPLAAWDFGDERHRDSLPESHPGASAVADIHDRDGTFLFTAVSLYGQWEMRGGDKNYDSCAKVHRILSDLTSVLATSRKRPAIVAGDFNLTTQRTGRKTPPSAAIAEAAFSRIRAWGFQEVIDHTRATREQPCRCICPPEANCSHVQTYRHGNKADSTPTQLDYAFMSDSLLPQLVECRVVHDERAWALSDHCPIALDLRLGGTHE